MDGCDRPGSGHLEAMYQVHFYCDGIAFAYTVSLFLQEKLLIREKMHADSVVILTSRSKALLCKYCDHVHEVSLLPLTLAKQLFAGYAFGSEQPSEAMRERATAIVASCGGLPLAIEVSAACLTADGRISRRHAIWVSFLLNL